VEGGRGWRRGLHLRGCIDWTAMVVDRTAVMVVVGVVLWAALRLLLIGVRGACRAPSFVPLRMRIAYAATRRVGTRNPTTRTSRSHAAAPFHKGARAAVAMCGA